MILERTQLPASLRERFRENPRPVDAPRGRAVESRRTCPDGEQFRFVRSRASYRPDAGPIVASGRLLTMASLQVLKGMTPGLQFPIEADRAILGRHPDCDIVLDVGAVSRQHAQILQIESDFYVEDLKSRNGTFVNGQQIRDRQRLEDNDRIKICDLLFTFHRGHAGPPGGVDPAVAEVVDDVAGTSGSTVMTKLEMAKARESQRFSVNAEAKLKASSKSTTTWDRPSRSTRFCRKSSTAYSKCSCRPIAGSSCCKSARIGPLIPKAVKHRRPSEETIRISRTIVSQVMARQRGHPLGRCRQSTKRFDSSQSITDSHSFDDVHHIWSTAHG